MVRLCKNHNLLLETLLCNLAILSLFLCHLLLPLVFLDIYFCILDILDWFSLRYLGLSITIPSDKVANSFIPKSIPTSLPVLGFLVISQSTVIDTKYWLAGFLDIVQERILPFSGIFLSITTLTQPIFSNLILSPSILNFWLGSLYDCVLPFFLNEGLPIFFPLFLEKYCFTVSLKSATFCWIAAADTSDSQGLSSIRSDFWIILGLGLSSLS